MIEIIMNEREWAEDAIRDGYWDRKPMAIINRIAKYYRSQGLKRSEIRRRIEEYILRCDPTASISKWSGAIDAAIQNSIKYPLIEIDRIVITETELDAVKKLAGVHRQRLMFTLLCLAKYGNAVSDKNNNWVNHESKDIFFLANITLTSKRQALIINDLWRDGYIEYSRIVDNVNLCVKIIDDEAPPVFEITDFRNLGNQFKALMGDADYFPCRNCGLVIKRTSPNHKYCPACAEDINRTRSQQNYWKRTANETVQS